MSKRSASSEDAGQEETVKKTKQEEVDRSDAADGSMEENGAEEGKRVRGKRHKFAILLSYSGRAYFGMQIQKEDDFPTIEMHLFDTLLDLRLISSAERQKPGDFWYQRAARTDKGVSAIRQVCSLILPLRDGDESSTKTGGSSGENGLTAASLMQAMNARLPEDIRVMAVKRTTRTFDAKNACESRTYAYTLPSHAFSRKDEDTTDFRISEDRLKEVNEILSSYEGTHNYFNFTCRRSATDTSCNRYIIRCRCSEPFVQDGIEFLTVHLTGQSFMLHQIRKMIGMCIAIVRGYTDKASIERAWIPKRYDVPIAPSLGLVLNEVHYGYYNKKFEKTHKPLDWTEQEGKIQAFRETYIDSVIVEMEKKESSMLQWLKTLEYHNFDSSDREVDGGGDEEDGVDSD